MPRHWTRWLGGAVIVIVAIMALARSDRQRPSAFEMPLRKDMPKHWIRWLRGIAIAITSVAAALALSWALSFWWQWLSLRWDSRTASATAVPAVAFVGGIWWLWWRLPKRQLRWLGTPIDDPKGRADTEDNFRKTVGQALGGAAVLIGAVFAYLQFSAQQQATRDQLQSAHDLLISNQVSKGFEQLAGDKLEMKLGGIYALQGVMNTSPEYHRPVLEALCAFVRNGTANKTVGGLPATEIQAALTVIGQRKQGEGVVNLTGANIPGADLTGTDLTNANLTNANLTNANLTNANLTDANLGPAFLGSGASSSGTSSSATPSAPPPAPPPPAPPPPAPPSGTTFGATIGVTATDTLVTGDFAFATVVSGGANLTNADLTNANLTNANLTSATLTLANLTGVDLSETRGLTQDQLNQACGKPKALPPELTLDKPCPFPSRAPAASKP